VLFAAASEPASALFEAVAHAREAHGPTLLVLDDAVEAAAEFLYQANMPLVYGLSNITCEAQREAVALAELVGGVVDSHTSL
jgi:formylmethanofuran dehydrogenase subunit B